MQHFKISLPETDTTVTAYLRDVSPEIIDRKRPAVLICPGGGYEFTSDREAEPMALAFVAAGYQAFVLRYSVAPARYPTALWELAATMTQIREHAEEWRIDPEQIATVGFSAGGHLAGCLGAFWNREVCTQKFSAEKIRPNAQVLCYPVITSGEYGHAGSFESLLGTVPTDDAFSLEHQVSRDTPPTFLWHTQGDQSVPVENALLLATALQAAGVPLEFHLFAAGRHGLSLANEEVLHPDFPEIINPRIASWFPLCLVVKSYIS